MKSSANSLNEIAIQSEFDKKTKQLTESLKIVAKNKEAHSFLFREYDTFIKYQEGCIKLCEFIIKWITEPAEFKFSYSALSTAHYTSPEYIDAYVCEYDKELRKLALGKQNVYQLLSEYIEQIKLEQQNIQTTNKPLLAQITFLENNRDSFKNALQSKSLKDNAALISLDLRILLLGYVRYYLNDGIKVEEEHLHHFVNNEKKFDEGNLVLDKNTGIKIDRLKEITDENFRKVNAPSKASIFLRVLQRVVDINQFDFNKSGSGTNFKFFQRLTNAEKSVLEEVTNFEDILKVQLCASTLKDINSISSEGAWQWCKHELLLSSAGLGSEKIYRLLKSTSMVTEEKEIFEDQEEICKLLNIKYQTLNNEDKNNIKKEGDDEYKTIKDKSDVSYFNQLVQFAKNAASHRNFLTKLKDKVDDSLEIKTKATTKGVSGKNSDTPFNEALKIFKQKTIEQLLVLRNNDSSFSLTPTIILESYLGHDRKRGPFTELYIKYIDQLFGANKNRYEGRVYPGLEDLQIFTNKLQSPKISSSALAIKIKSFISIQGSLGDCVTRIHSFLKDESVDPLISDIVADVTDVFGVTRTEVFSLIESGITRVHSTKEFDSEQVIDFKSLFDFVEKDNPLYSQESDYVSLYTVNVFLRLLINMMLDSGQYSQEYLKALIKKSLDEELECSHRVAVHLEFLNKVIVDENKFKMLESFEEFKHDQIQIAKIVSTFHLLYGENEVSNSNIEKLIESYSKGYFEQKSNPRTLKEFVESPKSKITKDKELKLKIDGFSTEKLLETGNRKSDSGVFVLHADFERELQAKGWDSKSIQVALAENGIVESVWHRMLSCSDDMLFTTLLSSYLDSGTPTKTYTGRGHYKSYITYRGYYNSFVKSVMAKGFADWLFPHTKDHMATLENKLEVLGNIQYLGDERFEVKTDDNGNSIKLGQGSFGAVYLCKDKLLDTIVAIKLIPTWDDNERIRKKLISEASIMRQAQHKNVATVYDLHQFKLSNISYKYNSYSDAQINMKEKAVFGIVMEYINGAQTLQQFVKTEKFKAYSYKEKLELFIQICQGVEKAHNLTVPVVHGDIKPDNILIDENGTPKLVDFGVSSYSGSYLGTSSGQVYSSPNICEGGTATVQDDIYSLAMVLIYILFPRFAQAINNYKGKASISNLTEAMLLSVSEAYYDIAILTKAELEESGNSYFREQYQLNSLSELSSVFDELLELGVELVDAEISLLNYFPTQILLKSISANKLRDIEQLANKLIGSNSRYKHLIPKKAYSSVNALAFDVGILKHGGALNVKKQLTYGNIVISNANIGLVPKCKSPIKEQAAFKIVGSVLKNDAELIYFNDLGQSFSVPIDFKNDSRLRLFKSFYEPYMASQKIINRIDKFGINFVELNQLWQVLFDRDEQTPAHLTNYEAIEQIDLTTLSVEMNKFHSNAYNQLKSNLNDIFQTESQHNAIAGLIFLNSLPKGLLLYLKNFWLKKRNIDSVKSKVERSFPDIDFDMLDEVLLSSGNDMLESYVERAQILNSCELIEFAIEAGIYLDITSKFEEVISKFLHSKSYEALNIDLKKIEAALSWDAEFLLLKKCYENDNLIELT